MAVRRRRFTPDFDPVFGDRPLAAALQDIVIGRWQTARDLLYETGDDWPLRTHRLRLLAHTAAETSAAESWRAAEPDSADGAVLGAATQVVRVLHTAVGAGAHHAGSHCGGCTADRAVLDATVLSCLKAADARPADPMPWVSLLTLARLYEEGVSPRELWRWQDELRRRDPYNMEGHVQLLRYYSARWHGTHGTMYDFARDAAGAAPLGSPLPVLVQIARVEEYRYIADMARGRPVRGFDQHWKHELAEVEVRRTWHRWILGRPPGPPAPHEVGDLNCLTHAACHAGLKEQARSLFTLLGRQASRVPWSYTGDPAEQFTRFRKAVGAAGPLG
ncbi:hypothetical protein QCN29_19590 [Streptomyces sp. HNM0663]|uniref:DUF4034 domain-containing protein n=1 Tax=Streptomyces chengmaiensis TaxID=3040919 RepID=A0ABT6HQG1_9ACTN|nr:hypothetical protein [Streptomyces chengmaiensis]MDH2390953.1 hypothetical protein [Streptomyces chengmaiensis]